MAGHRLGAAKSAIPIFTVVGEYARPNQDQFVVHVAIVRDDCEIAFGETADVWHCAPPIVAGVRTSAGSNRQFDRCDVHAVSFLEDLSPDDVAGIETTLAEIDAQTRPAKSQTGAIRHYIVHPPVEWVRDEQTGTRRFRKFSCVGFVCECYREGAGIQLINLESAELPAVDLETLAGAYGDRVREERRRERFGIIGSEPWQIALAGYVMHALNRPSNDVRLSPYTPNGVAEAAFPVCGSHFGNPPSAGLRGLSKAKKGTSGKQRPN